MKKKIYITVGVIVVVLALSVPFLMRKYGTTPVNDYGAGIVPAGKLVTGTDIETFSGTIMAVDTSCFSDGICSVTVNGKKIILVKGGRGLPPDTAVGRLIGVDSIGDLEGKIGQHANVFAGLTPEGDYSIYGNTNYYVEVLDLKD